MRRLKCSNPNCDGADQRLFNVIVVIDGDRVVAENINNISAEHFECVFCFSPATAAESDNS